MRARNPYFPSKSQVHPGLPDFTHPHVGLPMAWLGALNLGSSLDNLRDVWEFSFPISLIKISTLPPLCCIVEVWVERFRQKYSFSTKEIINSWERYSGELRIYFHKNLNLIFRHTFSQSPEPMQVSKSIGQREDMNKYCNIVWWW